MTTAAEPQAEAKIKTVDDTARQIVQDDVYVNVGLFMDYCISRVFEGDEKNPFTEDELDFRVDPSDWDAQQCHEYIKDELGETWQDATGESWEVGQREEPVEEAREFVRLNGSADAIALHSDLPLDEWEPYLIDYFITYGLGKDWEEATGIAFDATVASIEESNEGQNRLLQNRDYEDEIEKAREYIRDNATEREPYEWWAVSNWLARKLKSAGYIVLDAGNFEVWGRETTGQAIYMDGAIQEIARQLMKDRGEIV